jgi:hypothetical protein
MTHWELTSGGFGGVAPLSSTPLGRRNSTGVVLQTQALSFSKPIASQSTVATKRGVERFRTETQPLFLWSQRRPKTQSFGSASQNPPNGRFCKCSKRISAPSSFRLLHTMEPSVILFPLSETAALPLQMQDALSPSGDAARNPGQKRHSAPLRLLSLRYGELKTIAFLTKLLPTSRIRLTEKKSDFDQLQNKNDQLCCTTPNISR